MKVLAGVCAALAIWTVGLVAASFAEATVAEHLALVVQQPGTEKVTPQKAAQAKNLTEDVTVVGCIRAWKPAPEDVTKLADNNKPGVAGIFLLTPIQSTPAASVDLPTYLLTPTQIVNFPGHLDDKVEVVGTAQAAPMPPTVQETVTAPMQRPENKPNAQAMPRLTVKSLKKISDSCP